MNFKDNIYSWDLENSRNVKSEVQSLSLKTNGEVKTVANLTEPINIKIRNRKMQGKNISFYMPGFVRIDRVDVNKSCIMLIDIKPLNDLKNETRLTVYIQYGRAPSPKDYEIKLTISNENGTKMEQLHGSVLINDTTSNNTKVMKLTRHSNVHFTGGSSLVMWNFSEFTYAKLNTTKRELYFRFSYGGPPPPLILQENPYTYDVLEFRGDFNYSFQAFCTKCSYWDVDKNLWKTDGCEVCRLQSRSLVTEYYCFS